MFPGFLKEKNLEALVFLRLDEVKFQQDLRIAALCCCCLDGVVWKASQADGERRS